MEETLADLAQHFGIDGVKKFGLVVEVEGGVIVAAIDPNALNAADAAKVRISKDRVDGLVTLSAILG